MNESTARTTTPPSASSPAARRGDEDQRVYLHGLSWEDFEAIVRIRGECSVPRIHFVGGELELLTPSMNHESIKKTFARLLETWSEERGPELYGVGSWLLKESREEAGAEPDECYVIDGEPVEGGRPDVAIEVIWTRGGLDRLEIYRRLGVREVWFWEEDRVAIHRLKTDVSGYDPVTKSELLPEVDAELLGRLAGATGSQTARVKALRAWLRGEGPHPEAPKAD